MIKRIELTVNEPLVCVGCGHVFEGIADACECIEDAVCGSVITLEQRDKMLEEQANERQEQN